MANPNQPPPKFDCEEQDFPVLPSDSFDAPRLEVGGFLDKTVVIAHQFAGQPPVSHGSLPLEICPELRGNDLMDLHAALLGDPNAMLYAAARHFHMGVAILTVSCTVGVQGLICEADFKLTDPDGYLRFAVASSASASAALQRAGLKQMRWLAQATLEQVIRNYMENP